MTRDEHYRSKIVFRGRGEQELARLIGGVGDEIEACLARRGRARVLELGCGHGTALLELGARYGPRIELHGWNLRAEDGDPHILVRNAVERGLAPSGDAARSNLPQLHYGDVAAGLPFATDTFDLVYSQVAWLYFGNKVAVLREIMRVLAPDGSAKIDADELRPGLPPEYARLVEIWDAGALVPLREYAREFGMTFMAAREGEYLRFGKCGGFGDDLEKVLEIDLSTLYAHWDGVKCVYRRSAGAPRPGKAS